MGEILYHIILYYVWTPTHNSQHQHQTQWHEKMRIANDLVCREQPSVDSLHDINLTRSNTLNTEHWLYIYTVSHQSTLTSTWIITHSANSHSHHSVLYKIYKIQQETFLLSSFLSFILSPHFPSTIHNSGTLEDKYKDKDSDNDKDSRGKKVRLKTTFYFHLSKYPCDKTYM